MSTPGEVYLVGAGPGDPELITVKGRRLVETADVLIHDRLIPHEVLQWCRPEATVIDVGKFPDHHRISQEEINALLVYHGRLGKRVVRLKGGDPCVFGRETEERQACQAAGIRCHLVPGVSSAIAGPAAAGIPVTRRGVARSLMIVTGQTAPDLEQNRLDFEAMVRVDTLILMMARKNLRQLTTGLIVAGRHPETPTACIERATCADQRVCYSTLYGIADEVQRLGLQNPMVTVIGEVAALVEPDQIQWPLECQEAFYALEFGE